MKHGGDSIISAAGTGRLVRIEGKMNGEKYREILDENLLQSAQDLRLGRRFTSSMSITLSTQAMQEWLQDKYFNVLEWASQSPALNPIDHLWRDLEIAVQ